MLYALKIAIRYLTANKAQTALLVTGVAVGVFIFIFMSALIGGLAEFILSRTVGDISHITIEAEDRDPAVLIDVPGHVLTVTERGRTRTATLAEAETWLPLIEAVPGVRAVSPQITGAGFLTRGAQVSQVSVTGVEPGRESAILDLDGYIVEGTARLGSGLIVLGRDLADDLALSLGQTVRLQSSGGVTALLTLSGIFETGNGAMDGARAFVSLPVARTLFAMPQGVTRIEIKLDDLNAAERHRPAHPVPDRPRRGAVDRRGRTADGGAERAGADRVFPQNVRAHHHRDRCRLGADAVHLPAQARDRDHAGDGCGAEFRRVRLCHARGADRTSGRHHGRGVGIPRPAALSPS
jgi:ABC-type lipoprotein release transport system permease subunit